MWKCNTMTIKLVSRKSSSEYTSRPIFPGTGTNQFFSNDWVIRKKTSFSVFIRISKLLIILYFVSSSKSKYMHIIQVFLLLHTITFFSQANITNATKFQCRSSIFEFNFCVFFPKNRLWRRWLLKKIILFQILLQKPTKMLI